VYYLKKGQQVERYKFYIYNNTLSDQGKVKKIIGWSLLYGELPVREVKTRKNNLSGKKRFTESLKCQIITRCVQAPFPIRQK